MKIMLIAPASGRWKEVGKSLFFNGRTFRFSLLSLLSVAAETPPDIEVTIIDEQIDEIPWDKEIDLAGITCMTALAPRAYEISSRFREKGIPVVLGGTHPTLCPEEALENADAVVAGDAEGIWQKVITDAENGKLKGIYKNDSPPELKGLSVPPRHLLKNKNYGTVQAVQASRGCSNGCSFCSISAFHNKTQRYRPVDEVINEVSSIPDNFFIFVDDNLTADMEYAAELFKKLIPLKKKWVTQSTLSICDDKSFVRLAAEAGCIGLFVGLETFSGANLDSVNKKCHRVDQYREAIELLHSNGICVEAGIVFGFDNDGPDVFGQTLDTLDRLEVDAVQISVFTPLPGTPGHKEMESRIFNRNRACYDFHNVVFRPLKMTADDLKAGHDWVTQKFYSPLRIIRRAFRHALRPGGFSTMYYLIAVNIAYMGRVLRWNIKGYDPLKKLKKSRYPFLSRLHGLKHFSSAVIGRK